MIVKPGQFVTSLRHMAKDLGISMQSLRTALLHLKSTHEITQQVTQHATLITIAKWEVYQSAGEKVTQQSTQHLTSHQHLINNSSTTIKEIKNKEEREEDINKNARAEEEEDNQVFQMNHKAFASIKASLSAGEI